MRRCSKAEEDGIRVHAAVREWTRSGLLGEKQGAALAGEVQPALKRTNNFLRIVLFVFTSLIAGASVLLFFDIMRISARTAVAAACVGGALLCFALAEFIIDHFRVYRFGVEEAFAVAGAVLAVSAAEVIASSSDFRLALVVGLSAGAIASLILYGRFGFIYAGVAALASAALVPFPLVRSEVTARILSALVLCIVFVLARDRHLAYGDDFPGDDYAAFQTIAWVGLYVVANLKISYGEIITGWFYWSTYVLIWLLPVVGLWIGIRARDRLLIGVNIAMFLTTLATNKVYLGLEHRTWDPMLLGMLLIGAGAGLRRWLASGPDGERHGFTSARILSQDARLMTVLSTASAAFQPHGASQQPSSATGPEFKGGRSGGGGATGEF